MANESGRFVGSAVRTIRDFPLESKLVPTADPTNPGKYHVMIFVLRQRAAIHFVVESKLVLGGSVRFAESESGRWITDTSEPVLS
jgi:hypothetical protein